MHSNVLLIDGPYAGLVFPATIGATGLKFGPAVGTGADGNPVGAVTYTLTTVKLLNRPLRIGSVANVLRAADVRDAIWQLLIDPGLERLAAELDAATRDGARYL
jgi:hypothetical protein